MANHSILSLRHIVTRLAALGMDPEPVLARHGLKLDKITLDSRIDCDLELRIFCDLCELSQDPLAGIKVGSSIGFTGYGPFSLMMLSCATPYEAVLCGLRYQSLTYLFSQLGVVPGQPSSELTLQPVLLPPWPFRLRIDMELAGTYKMLQDLQNTAGIDLRPEQVSLPYAKPENSRAYEEFYGCPVQFGDSLARIRMRNSKLQQPLSTADSLINSLYREQCEQLRQLALSESGSDLATRVRAHLALFRDEFPSAPAVAMVFGMSERSLRNHLSSQGLSFRQLLDEVRFARARQRLRESRDPIEEIARQLGYAEAAAFIHAFQRWSGTTPAAYRRAASED